MLDTSAIIALTFSSDPLHARARQFALERNLKLSTTSATVGEAYTFIRGRSNYAVAQAAVAPLRGGGAVSIHQLGEEADAATWKVIEEFAGVPLSYVDASLIALGRLLRIRRIFAFDEDFALAGLELAPEMSG